MNATGKVGKLFDEVVARSGLATMIGPGTVQRALAAVGVASPDGAGPDDYRRALPQIKARMAVYLRPDEVARAIQEIESLLRG
jgi:hypothetical protein